MMPYSLFHMLYRRPLLATSFSLQLVDSSMTQPVGKLEDVPVNIGDTWVLEDFIIVDMHETDNAQIILGRPVLMTAGCHIDVREGCISFEAEGRFAVFSHRKEVAASPYSSILDALPLSPEYDMEDILNDDSEWISYEAPDQGNVKVEFSAPMPPNKLKVEAPISNDFLRSKYCRFAQVVHSIPP